MAQPKNFQFPLAACPLALLAVAALFSRGLSFWFLLLLTEVLFIYVCVEVMAQRMPTKLLNASQDNCHRMNGTLSHRREAREHKALQKVRSDMWAVFLGVAFVATAELFVVNAYVFPVTLSVDVVGALHDNPGDFKSALRKRGIDSDFFRWSRGTTRASNSEIRDRMQWVWAAWPVILGLLLASFWAGVMFVRYAYLRVLREFQQGVAVRSQEYLNIDTGRLQG